MINVGRRSARHHRRISLKSIVTVLFRKVVLRSYTIIVSVGITVILQTSIICHSFDVIIMLGNVLVRASSMLVAFIALRVNSRLRQVLLLASLLQDLTCRYVQSALLFILIAPFEGCKLLLKLIVKTLLLGDACVAPGRSFLRSRANRLIGAHYGLSEIAICGASVPLWAGKGALVADRGLLFAQVRRFHNFADFGHFFVGRRVRAENLTGSTIA